MQIPLAALTTLAFGLSSVLLLRFLTPLVQHAAVVVPVAQFAVVLVIAALYTRYARPSVTVRELVGAHVAKPIRVYAIALGVGLTLQPLLGQVATWLTRFAPHEGAREAWLQNQLNTPNAITVIVTACTLSVVPALSEELLFRGVIFSGLRRFHSLSTTWFVSALLFGVAHAGFTAVVYATLAGLVLGFIRASTRALVPCVVAHFATNAAGLAAAKFASLDRQWYALPFGEVGTFGLLFALLLALLTALGFAVKRR